jgi:hypothetical protein
MFRLLRAMLWENLIANRVAVLALCGAAITLSTLPAYAQQQDDQLWMQLNTNVPVGNSWRLTLEQIARLSDQQGGLYQTEFGGLISYKLVRGVELGLGYRKVGTHNRNPASDEDRVRQHIVVTFNNFFGRCCQSNANSSLHDALTALGACLSRRATATRPARPSGVP